MRHWKTLIERDYLGAWSLYDPKTGKPRDVTRIIESVTSQKLKTRETPNGKGKIVIRLQGVSKGLVCNTTNAETIAGMYGDDVDKWIGKPITLYVTNVRSPAGGQVPAIRIRPQKPKQDTPSSGDDPSDVPVDEAVSQAQSDAFDAETGEVQA